MPYSRLDVASRTFHDTAEALHDKFLVAVSDPSCVECTTAGFSGALFTAWLQTRWGEFSRRLLVVSALGTRRKTAASVKAVPGVRTELDAEKLVKDAGACEVKTRGVLQPIWHDPLFVVAVACRVGLANHATIEATLSPTRAPKELTAFRNYLVHPTEKTRSRYQRLQEEFGLLNVEPQDFVYRPRLRGVPVFTFWLRELQGVAYASTR